MSIHQVGDRLPSSAFAMLDDAAHGAMANGVQRRSRGCAMRLADGMGNRPAVEQPTWRADVSGAAAMLATLVARAS